MWEVLLPFIFDPTAILISIAALTAHFAQLMFYAKNVVFEGWIGDRKSKVWEVLLPFIFDPAAILISSAALTAHLKQFFLG